MRTPISKSLISRILPDAKYTIADLEKMYPPRNLPDGAMVTRFAPSPTGFFHTGNLYPTIVSKKLAQQSDGIFVLRIEDTDTKREVPGAVDVIVNSLAKFGLDIDEGMFGDNKEVGAYGPYTQSARRDIYQSVAAELLADGRAYPCFLTAEEMEEIRSDQAASGLRTGIYGQFAKWRDASEADVIARLDAGEVPTVRLYSMGDFNRKIYCKDAVRGSIAFPENDEDVVLIKSNDGLPTYHFAMLCDDHFMRTTHLVRGSEYLPSFPMHIQMFNMMGWTPPVFIHNATIDILDTDTGNRRKLSKRKDRVAAVSNLWADGWAPESILEYVFNLVVSGYEEAKMKKPGMTIWDYPINVKKLPVSGALFDMKKLEWWAREFIATLSIDDLTSRVIAWANEYGDEKQKRQVSDKEYLKNILGIERDNPKRIRKDFITWKQTCGEIEYFFDDSFIAPVDMNINKSVLVEFMKTFDINDDKDSWWNKIKDVATALNIPNGEAAMALRVALTGRTNTPDLYSIMQVMGEKRVGDRIKEIFHD